jgi:hypothetical protein
MRAAELLDRLKRAEKYVEDGARLLDEQKHRIAELEGEGLDLGEARRLLQILEALVRLQVVDRDQLRNDLAGLPS